MSGIIKQANYLEEEIVIAALREQLGNMDLTAKSLGISRGQLNQYLIEHPAVITEKIQIKEAIKDNMEALLVERAKTSDAALMFFLRTQAKDRGYGAEATISGPGGGPVQIGFNSRDLIAAMRNGMNTPVEEENAEEDNQESFLFDQRVLTQ